MLLYTRLLSTVPYVHCFLYSVFLDQYVDHEDSLHILVLNVLF
jgi:hypothetical protein